MLFLKKGQPKKRQGRIDNISESFRLQIYYVIEDTLGKWKNSPFGPDTLSYPTNNSRWDAVERILLKKLGTSQLAKGPSSCVRVRSYILKCDPPEFLLVILAFLLVVRELAVSVGRPIKTGIKHLDISFESVLDGIHTIFRTNNFEYEIIESAAGLEAISIDSQYLHEEVIKKTRKLFYDLKFQGPLQEFDDALAALENQDYDTAINEALKAFESTMKAILQELKHPFNPKWAAKDLIKALTEAGVIPTTFGSLSTGVRTVLESGLPSIRNAPGVAHGSGRDPKEIEQSYAQFAVHLCGSYVVFMIKRFEEMR